MAQVPYSPAPDVVPTGPAAPKIGVSTPPAAFGVATAEAIRGLGQQGEQSANQMAETALYVRGLQNETWAKDEFVNRSQQLGKIESDFYSKKGANAVAAQDQYANDVRQVYEESVNNAPNPQAKRFLGDALSRRISYSIVDGQRHAGEQGLQYMKTVSENRVAEAMSTAAQHPNNDALFNDQLSVVRSEAQAQAEQSGEGKDGFNRRVEQYVSLTWEARLRAVGFNDPQRALKMLDDNADQIKGISPQGKSYVETIREHLQKRNNIVGADADANKIIGDYQPGKFGPLTTITTPGGKKATVSVSGAERMSGFLSDLEAAGAPLGNIGSYNPRKIAGTNVWSQHAFGNAVDIGSQTGRDEVSPEFRAWYAQNQPVVRAAMDKYGIVSGGDWRNPDLGHFELQRRPEQDALVGMLQKANEVGKPYGPEYTNHLVAQVENKFRQINTAYRLQEGGTFANLATAISGANTGTPITDRNSLLDNPVLNQQYESLAQTDTGKIKQQQLLRMIDNQSRRGDLPADQQRALIDRIKGFEIEAEHDPAARDEFYNMDWSDLYSKVDPALKGSLSAELDRVRRTWAKMGVSPEGDRMAGVISSVKPMMDAAGIRRSDNKAANNQYLEFIGALSAKVQSHEAVTGKLLSDKEIQDLAAPLIQRIGGIGRAVKNNGGVGSFPEARL